MVMNSVKIMSQPLKVQEIYELFHKLNLEDKYIIYIHLLDEVEKNESHFMEFSQKANDIDYLKKFLNWKKEMAIEELLKILPFLKTKNVEAKHIILKILPVLFSYVSLYDICVIQILQIIDIISVHSAFSSELDLFEQWFHVFEMRKNSRKKFTYKDETYVNDLPKIPKKDSKFYSCIGYAEVALFRSVHRWLRILRLHKYLSFFANLTYKEILLINRNNIMVLQDRINVVDMTQGAKNKILREVEDLRKRSELLNNIIKTKFSHPQQLEEAARDIKKIMRSPISATDMKLVDKLVDALKIVSNAGHALVGTSENMIPIYGLLISVLKEAYNCSYFQSLQKDRFNDWRQRLSGKINKIPECRADLFQSPVSNESTITPDSDDHQKLENQLSISAIEQSMELVAIRVANFVFS